MSELGDVASRTLRRTIITAFSSLGGVEDERRGARSQFARLTIRRASAPQTLAQTVSAGTSADTGTLRVMLG